MVAKDLLLELGTEEMPARFLAPAAADLAAALQDGLQQARIDFDSARTYATPRRLAVLISGVAESQRDLEQEKRGPSAQIAFDGDGKPTKAAIGFARGAGVDPSELVIRDTDQGAYVYAVIRQHGKPTAEVLGDVCKAAIGKLGFPKSMRWGSGDMRFARPLRWIVALFGEIVISFTVEDVVSGRMTRGHRFLSSGELAIPTASDYLRVLEAGYVVADMEKRKELIRTQVEEAARSVGGRAVIREDLLDEVSCLVEYPTAVCGSFAASYLDLPEEVLITPMEAHQRYFPVRDESGNLMNRFVAVRNGGTEHLDIVRKGNEKVLSARLADAKFFFDEDRKTSLADRVPGLDKIVFQEQLGTMGEKTKRIRQISAALVKLTKHDSLASVVDRTAYLCKADLLTNMVTEFPELQGVIGRDYAKLSGEPEEVACGIFEHYLPRTAGDQLPKSVAGTLVGIADKIDTIVGCFGIGLVPSGSQDPYGLRRRTLGIIQVILAGKLPLRIGELIRIAIEAYGSRIADPDKTEETVHEFFDQRFRGILLEQGYRYDLVDAVLAVERDDLNDVVMRLDALCESTDASYFTQLMVGFQRAANLLSKQDAEELDRVPENLQDRLVEDAEKLLFEALRDREQTVRSYLGESNYSAAMEVLAGLEAPINRFFDEVMVMVEDVEQRTSRLALLKRVVDLMTQVADFRKIVQQA